MDVCLKAFVYVRSPALSDCLQGRGWTAAQFGRGSACCARLVFRASPFSPPERIVNNKPSVTFNPLTCLPLSLSLSRSPRPVCLSHTPPSSRSLFTHLFAFNPSQLLCIQHFLHIRDTLMYIFRGVTIIH